MLCSVKLTFSVEKWPEWNGMSGRNQRNAHTYNIQVFSVSSTKNYALEEVYFYSTYNTIPVYVDYASI